MYVNEIKFLETTLYNYHLKNISGLNKYFLNELDKKFVCNISNNLFFINKYIFEEIINSSKKIIIIYNFDTNEWILKNKFDDMTVIEITRNEILSNIIKYIKDIKTIEDNFTDEIDILCDNLYKLTINKKVIKKIKKK